ncbi:MAG: M1 family metallopeptidase, partial [Gemmatimonadota bacterium]
MLIALFSLAAAVQAAPGANTPYWQQSVRYEIHASLNELTGVLSGTQRVVYVNHSPDALDRISFHLHLNAFRPGSRWADADSVERRRRFNDLKDPDFAFNHVRNVRIMGQPATAIYPYAPDSTIVRFLLPAVLAPGDSMVVDLDWDARPSTVPRRQGRRGRHFDFAQWYPKVVVYDKHGWAEHPLYPGGEFYGEFATYLVDLDVAEDQVLGATGVPICGDPGWERVNQVPDRPVQYQRDFYPNAPACAAVNPTAPAPGRKRVVWYAEQVHHFALSMTPDYKYEGSAWGKVAIHVLYRPGDEATWGHGIATSRTAKALEWLDGFFGPFEWPQMTNLHRIEGGGTEFPMMVHNGSASQGLIVHEVGHNYVMGILANNEWREGWLDEGFTSFQESLFEEAQHPGTDGFLQTEGFLTGMDLDGIGEPASLPGEDYRDFTSYNIAIYSRGEQFFHELRYVVGDETLHRIMRTFYDRWKLKHVDEAGFRSVAEEVSGMDLSTLMAQQLHGNALVDYAVGRVTTSSATPCGDVVPCAPYTTKVEVIRKGEGRLPVEVWVIGESDTAVVRTDGLAGREWVSVETRSPPKQVLLDPRLRTRDWNMLNNSWRRGFLGIVSREPKRERYIDTWFSERSARDHRTEGWMPAAWYNDAGGITLGLRTRENYFGRFEENQSLLSYGTGWQSDKAFKVKDQDFMVRAKNPTWLRSPGLSQTLEAYNVEGRFGGRLAVERTRRDHLSFGPTTTFGLGLTWLQPDDFRYLDPGYYDNAGTVELAITGSTKDRRGAWTLGTRTSLAGGIAYNRLGLNFATARTELDPFYGRFTLETTAHRDLGTRWGVGLRFYGGVSTSGDNAVKQRQIYLSGADPLEQFSNPFLRSRGALLLRPDL